MKSQQSLKLLIMDYVFYKKLKSRVFWIFKKNVKNVFSNYGRVVRPTGPNSEARRAEWGKGSWGGELGELPLPTSYGVWGNAVSSPSGVRGEAPANSRFCTFFIDFEAPPGVIFSHNSEMGGGILY